MQVLIGVRSMDKLSAYHMAEIRFEIVPAGG